MFWTTTVPKPSVPAAPARTFAFVEHAPLVDEELELVVPAFRWIGGMMAACRHPLTCKLDSGQAETTRRQLRNIVDACPDGHEPLDLGRDRSPAYHFWMRLRPEYSPPVPFAGTVCLRLGHGLDLQLYYGHIGYGVYPPARGRHYAERACRLMFPLARAHHLNPLWITTDPGNAASRRTCQRLGGLLVDEVDVPPNHALYARGQKRKCRYRIDL